MRSTAISRKQEFIPPFEKLEVPAVAKTKHIEFTSYLRGIAVLTVLLGHFCGTFWLKQEAIGQLLNVPSLKVSTPWPINTPYFSFWHVYGNIGVPLFYLISGFVIPFSLKKNSRSGFILARLVRVYPIYFVGLSVTFLTLYVLGLSQGKGFLPYSYDHIVAQFLLVRGWFWMPSIDGVSLTLEILLIFYGVAALFAPFIFNNKNRFIEVYSFLVSIVSLFLISNIELFNGFQIQTGLRFLSFCLPYTIFTFIGTLFFLASNGLIKVSQLIEGIAFSLLCFFVVFGNHPDLLTIKRINYITGFVVFTFFFLYRANLKPNRFLNFFANIGFPLFAVHAIPGYSLMYYMVTQGYSLSTVLCTALMVTIGLAFILHRTLEPLSQKLGKNIVSRLLPPLKDIP